MPTKPFEIDPGGAEAKSSKKALRKTFVHRRLVIPEDLRSTTRWKVINHLRTLISEVAPAVIALYHPIEGEIDLMPLVNELWRDNQTVALPRVVSRKLPLIFNIWQPHGPLEPDALGILSATGAEVSPAMMVIPMLGYTRKGYRLGMGDGFYDRTIANLPQPAITVGVCYTELEVKDFPAEQHDIRLNYVITGKEVIVC